MNDIDKAKELAKNLIDMIFNTPKPPEPVNDSPKVYVLTCVNHQNKIEGIYKDKDTAIHEIYDRYAETPNEHPWTIKHQENSWCTHIVCSSPHFYTNTIYYVMEYDLK